MRIYENCREMHSEVRRDLHEMGVRVQPQSMQDKDVSQDERYETLELSPCVFSILHGDDRDAWLAAVDATMHAYAVVEASERWDAARRVHRNPGQAWKTRPELWAEYIHNGVFAYTYSERLAYENQLAAVVGELATRPNTRQAVLQIFMTQHDLLHLGGRARVPCSLSYQLLRRRDGLHCYYVMRSSDFLTHFPVDIYLALDLQARVARQLGVAPATFTFFTGSLHIYRKDADAGVF